jgi:hypothetical protein
VSDAFCSALWGADYMLHMGAAGYMGVNLHGGGDGYYTPIESMDAVTATPRPLYYGMQFAQLFAGLRFVSSQLRSDDDLTAYMARGKGFIQTALINKNESTVTVKGLLGQKSNAAWSLTAPALTSQTGVSLRRIESGHRAVIAVPSYSALVCRWDE